MSIIQRIRNKLGAKDAEIERLSKANEALTEHNLKLAADNKAATDETSRLKREVRKAGEGRQGVRGLRRRG